MAIREKLMSNDKAQSGEQSEGVIARRIEAQTSRIPSDWFLWAAVGSIGAAFALQMRGNAMAPRFVRRSPFGRKLDANFVGQWAPTLLLLGIYNKMVKLLGHDAPSRAAQSYSREQSDIASSAVG